jgi:hypothetical protein|nr:MAG TPA: hypothetical protein [Caudoviricetes sp.]
MEVIDYNEIINISKEITLKALDKDLICVNRNNVDEAAKTIVQFFDSVSNGLSNLSD